MKERLKQLRKALDITQQEFADKIGIKRNSYANYETGRNTPIDAIILSICKEWNVNENWLRTGDGEMFVEIPEEDMFSKAAASLLREDDATGMEGLILYHSLPPELKKAAREYILKLADAIREHENKKE